VKTILAYGDSLTWGANAITGRRHRHEDQWPTVLEASLNGSARVVNASLGGRTTMFDDYGAAADRNGARVLPTVLGMFEPIDLVIFMLGTNDLKTWVTGSAVGAAQGIKRLVQIVHGFPYENGRVPQVLIVAPPMVDQFGPSEAFPLLSPRTQDLGQLANTYHALADALGTGYFDAGTVASAKGGGDGVHLDVANTAAIGTALAVPVATLLGLRKANAA
jgi:lysophospholipase L1-like esterase